MSGTRICADQSRFVRLDACELYPGVAFYVVGFVRHFRDLRTQYVFADAGCGESGNQSGARNACDGHMRYVWTTMPILSIKHVTTYRYRQPVAFGEHRIMLRPRDDEDQRLLQSALEIRPKPRELAWGRDRLGNHVAIAHFDDRSDELRVVSTICLKHMPNGFYEADIKDYARIYPFSYIAEDWSRLRRSFCRCRCSPNLDAGAINSLGMDQRTRMRCSST